ncbi:MAG: MraY family glycosyltransferase [Flavobacteriales bacterium]
MGFTLGMIYLLLGFSKSLGIRSKNDIQVRWSNTSKPSLGGIAIFVSVFISTIIYLISHPTQNIFGDQRFLYFFIGVSLAFIMGLADDAFNTRPLIKLFTQFLCGLSVVASQLLIPLSGIYWIDSLVTIIWVIGLMNSLNMLDNMDGITASIAINTLLFLLAFRWFFSETAVDINTFIIIGLVGSLSGFLIVNAPPSKLFMGDSGSQVIGFAIAYFSIHVVWSHEPNTTPFWVSSYATLLMLAIPFIDTFAVTFNRIKAGKSPAKGGKDHTTHHMVYRGFTQKQTFFIFWMLSCLFGSLGIVVMYVYRMGNLLLPALPVIPFFVTFYYLFKNTHAYKAPINKDHTVD